MEPATTGDHAPLAFLGPDQRPLADDLARPQDRVLERVRLFLAGEESLRNRSSMARSFHRICTLPSGASHRSPGSIQPQVLSRLAISTHGWNLPVVTSSVQV